jgi:hypothetical protein
MGKAYLREELSSWLAAHDPCVCHIQFDDGHACEYAQLTAVHTDYAEFLCPQRGEAHGPGPVCVPFSAIDRVEFYGTQYPT